MGIPEAVSYLVAAGHRAPSADNVQPWSFRWDGHQLSLTYDHERVTGKTFPEGNQATLLTMGAVAENLSQATVVLGLPRPEFGSISQRSANEFLRLFVDGANPVTPDAWQVPLFQRHTNRLPFRYETLPKVLLNDVVALWEGYAKVTLIDDHNRIAAMANLVRISSEVRFQTPEIHEWFSRSLRFSAEEVATGDGLDVKTFDLPPGGRLILGVIREWSRMRKLNKVGACRLLAQIEAMPIRRARALLAITGPAKDRRMVLNAGRLMERVWIELNRRGVGVQPYYVIADQLERLSNALVPPTLQKQVERLRAQAMDLLGCNDDTFFMLLRIGWPKADPPRSVRLPLDRVLSIGALDDLVS